MAETKGFYVGVKEPVSLRRNILESLKSVIQRLKDYENLKLIRKEKYKNVLEFRDKINEILVLLSDLKEHLPKHELGENVHVKRKAEKNKKGKTKKVEIETDEIEKLENDLTEIESRLRSI